jgi:hypothetical protein
MKSDIHKPTNILFIKLGEKGSYEKDCIEDRGIIKLGYHAIDHSACLSGQWGSVEQQIVDLYKTWPSATTSHKNQIRKFYEEPDSTMWISFYNGKLWYCYAEREVKINADGTKERKTISGWSDSNSDGESLFIQYLSGRLTKVQGFRGTICDVKEKGYLLHKINNTQSSELVAVEKDIQKLKGSLEFLIKKLNHRDFEVFIDLIFRSAAWSRIGTLGKTTKTIDIELLAPVTNERAVVQVKSESNLSTFLDYKERLKNMGDYEKIFFVTHTPSKDLQAYIDQKIEQDIQIWDAKKLSELSINAGLIEWIVNVAP